MYHQDWKRALEWTARRVEIIFFCADFWALWGASDFLPKRTAALAVDAEGG